VLDVLSVDYHETIMAAAGHQAEENLARTVRERPGRYLVVVEGSIPTGADGAYCTIGGRSALQIAREVCGKAAATIAMGTCATFGGLPAAAPNPTGALGVADAVPGVKNLINLSACPANVENLTALLVYFLTFKHWPPSTRGGGRCSPTASRSTTTASAAHTSTSASTSRPGATRPTAPGTACTRWDARGP
jgi:hydrogenase small subunit